MLRPNTAPTARRGQALIVTLASLALLALVGITAVYFTRDQAEQARIRGAGGAANNQTFADDGLGAMNAFLSSLLYDAPDDGAGLLNSTRGHSLMATMFGRPQPGQPYPTLAWSGPGSFGTLNETVTVNGETPFARPLFVNHRLLRGPGGTLSPVYDPEWSGQRGPFNAAVGSGAGQTYYGKNAPYTYPDLKDFYLAVMCPATGEILVPSFHRNSAFGPLAPTNPKWNTGTGVVQTPRPTRFLHPNFPPIPPNADGTYTGDVQNLPGGVLGKNDSIWVDIGLPPITLPNGKRVKPLVAPLILDLDGRLNLSVHGNLMSGGATPSHTSGDGFGPWEISLEQAFGANFAEARAIVAARGTPRTQYGQTQKAFYARYAAATELPQYAQASWRGFTAANPLQLPGFGGNRLFHAAPLFANGYDASNNPANFAAHPSLLNPNEWPTTTNNPRAFPLSDTKLLAVRYAPYPTANAQLTFAAQAPNTLRGSFPIPAGSPAVNTLNTYRVDQAHANRQLFTTHSAGLDRSGLMPGAGQAQSPLAALAPLDLNRQLADYRDNTGQPLAAANVTAASVTAANNDRQQFAADIFARLLAATGPLVGSTVSPLGVVTITATPGTPEYDALRAVAQVAANIVDYIDNDDINTRFVWNSAGATPSETTVFGVEKPRLLLTEAYSEVTNDPSDMAFSDPMATAQKDAQVRFWLELQNPTSNPYTAPGAYPLGDGSVKLRDGGFSPYRVEIVRNTKAGNITDRLRNPGHAAYPGNVTGDFGVAPDVIFDFSTATAAQQTILPSNGAHSAGIAVCGANVPMPPPGGPDFNPTLAGMISSGATPAAIGGSTTALSYPLPLTNVLAANAIAPELTHHVVALRRLANPYLPFDAANNPYVTVDVLNHVRTADRVLLANNSRSNAPRTPKTATMPGYDPNTAPAAAGDPERPPSYGKVQPYAGWSSNVYTFPASMVLPQNPATVGTGADGVRHTLGRANFRGNTAPAAQTFVPGPPASLTANDTLMTPFDWLVHLDRPLVNQVELLHVTAGKPHELTTDFIRPNATNGVDKHRGSILDRVTRGLANDQLYRALDLLRVQPFGHQTALGGRVDGRVNINTIQDIRVWRALFDANAGNGFTPAFVDNLWNQMIATRTRTSQPFTDATGAVHTCPVPGPTVHDTGLATDDRPFLPFGAAIVPTGGGTLPAGTNLDDTLLRRNPATSLPFLTSPGNHPYQNAEALRKILNNTTTVSHTFAVWMTVGYFEIDPGSETPPAGWPTATVPWHGAYGREFYREVPGDTRHKFFAVVDRSTVGLDPAQFAAGTYAHATTTPFFTTLEVNAQATAATFQISASAGTPTSARVFTNGTGVDVGGTLVLGVGATREIVTVTGVSYNAATGLATVTAGAPLQFNHWAGESASSVVSGNPGPQPGFDVNLDRYKTVVPHWSRVQ